MPTPSSSLDIWMPHLQGAVERGQLLGHSLQLTAQRCDLAAAGAAMWCAVLVGLRWPTPSSLVLWLVWPWHRL